MDIATTTTSADSTAIAVALLATSAWADPAGKPTDSAMTLAYRAIRADADYAMDDGLDILDAIAAALTKLAADVREQHTEDAAQQQMEDAAYRG